MKAQAQAAPESLPAARARFADYLELTKPRIASLVLVVTLAGFYMGTPGAFDPWLAMHTLLATGLVAAGACAINHAMEWRLDARMDRTANRPLPAGRLAPAEALAVGAVLGVAGALWLAATAGALAASLAALTLILYLAVYTPLKRLTELNTLVGAIPGALPPLIGWAAAAGSLSRPALTLFAILFLWQLPHFYAIAWLYREDYARGGFQMLSVNDPTGDRTARQIMVQSFLLVAVSLLPSLWGQTGPLYFTGALILGAAFWWTGWRLARDRAESDARRVLLASIIYLPLLLGVMALDKI